MLIVGDSVLIIWGFDYAYVLGVGDAKSGYEQTLIIKGFSIWILLYGELRGIL